MKYAVIVGRFQPFHKGHLEAVVKMSREHEKNGIGIFITKGVKDTEKILDRPSFSRENNPFTLEEVRRMVEASTRELKNVTVFRFYSPVLHSQDAFRSSMPFPAEETVFLTAVKDANEQKKIDMITSLGLKAGRIGTSLPYSSGEIRQSLAAGDGKWRKMVPKGVETVLDDIRAEDRLKDILFE